MRYQYTLVYCQQENQIIKNFIDTKCIHSKEQKSTVTRRSFTENATHTLLGSQHVLRLNPFGELLLCQVTQRDSLLFERRSVLVGSLGDLGSFVVADVRVEGSHQHEGLVKELVYSFTVDCDPVLE